MKVIKELPNIQIHPEVRIEYYQLTKLRVVNDFLKCRKIRSHFYRQPWLSEKWEALILFGFVPRLVRVMKAKNFEIIREFIV